MGRTTEARFKAWIPPAFAFWLVPALVDGNLFPIFHRVLELATTVLQEVAEPVVET